jgi:CDP-diacylglycerol---glycerol-3-phosphate 3-phosphatidyltransferase
VSGSAAVLAAVLLLAFLSMAVFALRGSRPDADAEKRGTHFLLGGGDFVVHWFLWAISPLDALSLRAGLGPDAYNLGGLLSGVASGIAAGSGRLDLAGWAIALGGVCDIMDGRMARARQLSSKYGMFIDSTLDRFVEVFAFLGFVLYLRDFAYGPLAAAAAITGSLLVSYARARGESVGVLCKEGLMQRAERLVLTFLACMLDGPLSHRFGWRPGSLLLWTLALIAAGTFATAAHRTLWIASRLKAG